MFTISHAADGAFRLEIHAAPEELGPEDVRLLRAVLRGLADQIPEPTEHGTSTDSGSARVEVSAGECEPKGARPYKKVTRYAEEDFHLTSLAGELRILRTGPRSHDGSGSSPWTSPIRRGDPLPFSVTSE